MAVERTFAIIKPDAVKNKVAGQILARIEASGLEIVAMRRSSSPSRGRRASTPSTRRGPCSPTWSSS